jgi:hypothetical protein
VTTSEHLVDVRIEIAQGERVLIRIWLPRVMSGRSATFRDDWLERMDPTGPQPVARLLTARRR